MGFQKNVAGQKWLVYAINTTNSQPVTGDAANITAKIRKDYGAATATNDVNPTELEHGFYEFDLTQAETNANVLDLIGDSSTANVEVMGAPTRSFTVPAGFLTGSFPSVADFLAGTGDTNISVAKLLEMGAAFFGGKVTATSSAGVTTYVYYKRDGTTVSFRVYANETGDIGTRSTTGALS